MTTPELSSLGSGLPAGKLLYRVPEAMTLLSISRTVIYEEIRSGRLRSVKRGCTRLIPAAALQDYLALLDQEAEHSAGRRAA